MCQKLEVENYVIYILDIFFLVETKNIYWDWRTDKRTYIEIQSNRFSVYKTFIDSRFFLSKGSVWALKCFYLLRLSKWIKFRICYLHISIDLLHKFFKFKSMENTKKTCIRHLKLSNYSYLIKQNRKRDKKNPLIPSNQPILNFVTCGLYVHHGIWIWKIDFLI